MTDDKVNPAILAQPGSGFRFPTGHSVQSDQVTSELRMVILGWLKQAQLAAEQGGVQQLRDAVFRAAELTIGLSAREIAVHLEREQSRKRELRKVPRNFLNGAGHAPKSEKRGRSKTPPADALR